MNVDDAWEAKTLLSLGVERVEGRHFYDHVDLHEFNHLMGKLQKTKRLTA
jgi:hypothetical protein